MGERELLRLVREYVHACPEKEAALAAPPDVVAVLRRLDKVEGMMISADLLALELEKQFYVRLTDDGWKWTEEELDLETRMADDGMAVPGYDASLDHEV